MKKPSSLGKPAARAFRSGLLLLTSALLTFGVRVAGAGAPGDEPTIAPLEPVYQFQPDVRAQLAEAGGLIGAGLARQQFSVNGSGLTAAVLDTGIYPTHQDFAGGKIVEQHNYTSDNAGNVSNALDGDGHGTNVSGIIAANGVHTGIAPGANVVAMKVLRNDGQGSFDSVANALQYVLDNHSRLNITVVNLSLGSSQNLTSAPTNNSIRNQISQLRTEKVAVVISAGNGFYSFNSAQGMSYPAVIPECVSVGAVYDAPFAGSYTYGSGAIGGAPIVADQICPFSQRLHSSVNSETATDIFAPGAAITSTGNLNNTGSSIMHGTSQAAPVTAGVILLMQQYHLRQTGQLPSIDAIEGWLKSSAVSLVDSNAQVDNVLNTGLTFKRVNALGALLAMQADLGGEGNLMGRITANGTGLEGVSVSIGGQSVQTDANGSYQFEGLAQGQFTVTPSKPPYVFTPATRTVNVAPNAVNVDFTAAIPTYTVTGTVKVGNAALAGAVVSAGGQNATTQTNGTYLLSGLVAGTYDVSVVKSGYRFAPATVPITVGPNRSAINFTASRVFTVGGTVTLNKTPLPGVTVTLQHPGGNQTATTAANGTYTFDGVAAGAYKLIPALSDHLFTPASRAGRVANRNITGMNFAGAVIPDLTSLTLTKSSVKGSRPTTATVLLNGKAPVAIKVALTSATPTTARVPATVTIPKGKTSARFNVTTKKVLNATPVVITATFDGASAPATLLVTP